MAIQHKCAGVAAKGVKSLWPQAVAQALVLNHMMEFDAGIKRRVPVFAGDLNEHMIVHYADKKTLHVATSSEAEGGKRIAVGCMRQLLSTALGTPEAALAGGHMSHCRTFIRCIATLLSPVGTLFVYQHVHVLMCR